MRCRVKICGVTSVADALGAGELGADVVGLNFYSRSPRRIDEATARDILAALPAAVEAAMLSVDESWHDAIARAGRLPGLRFVQVHRTELTPPPALALPWVPAFALKDETSLRSIEAFLDRCETKPAAILVDAHVPGSFGGTGRSAPWQLLEGFDPGVPLILAGGLTPENVAEAVGRVRPFMVDVASGVENVPGRKDVDKMKRFVEAVNAASSGMYSSRSAR